MSPARHFRWGWLTARSRHVQLDDQRRAPQKRHGVRVDQLAFAPFAVREDERLRVREGAELLEIAPPAQADAIRYAVSRCKRPADAGGEWVHLKRRHRRLRA